LNDADVRTLRALDLLSNYLTVAFERFEVHLAAIPTSDDPEEVHQARVGVRRMRCALRTYRPVFDRLWARSVRNAAVLIAYPLGRVRDADVTFERERMLMHELGMDAPHVSEAFDKIRTVRREHLLLVLGSEQSAETLELMKDAVQRPRLVAGAGTTIGDLLPNARSAWRKVRKSVSRLGSAPSDADLHRVRILTKRARYAVEMVRPVIGDDAKRFCRAAAAFQDELGELQDAAIARAWLFELIPMLDADGASQAHRLATAEAERAQDARAGWHDAWEALSGDETVAWLDA